MLGSMYGSGVSPVTGGSGGDDHVSGVFGRTGGGMGGSGPGACPRGFGCTVGMPCPCGAGEDAGITTVGVHCGTFGGSGVAWTGGSTNKFGAALGDRPNRREI